MPPFRNIIRSDDNLLPGTHRGSLVYLYPESLSIYFSQIWFKMIEFSASSLFNRYLSRLSHLDINTAINIPNSVNITVGLYAILSL